MDTQEKSTFLDIPKIQENQINDEVNTYALNEQIDMSTQLLNAKLKSLIDIINNRPTVQQTTQQNIQQTSQQQTNQQIVSGDMPKMLANYGSATKLTTQQQEFYKIHAPKVYQHLSKLNKESNLGMNEDQINQAAARITYQFGLESGWGTSNYAKKYNNFGGVLNFSGGTRKSVVFKSIDDFYDYMFNRGKMYGGIHKNALLATSNDDFVKRLRQSNYITDKDLQGGYAASYKNDNPQLYYNWAISQFNPSNTTTSSTTIQSNNIDNLDVSIQKWLGKPYIWGGWGNNGSDCSSFAAKVYKDMGMDFGIVNATGMWFNKSKTYNFNRIDRSQVQKGDLVFLDSTNPNGMILNKGTKNALHCPQGSPTHVAIFLKDNGDGSIQVAESSKGGSKINTWKIDPSYKGHYFADYSGSGRLKILGFARPTKK